VIRSMVFREGISPCPVYPPGVQEIMERKMRRPARCFIILFEGISAWVAADWAGRFSSGFESFRFFPGPPGGLAGSGFVSSVLFLEKNFFVVFRFSFVSSVIGYPPPFSAPALC
jgi:hypothetical protein